jgi:hypothetical protein
VTAAPIALRECFGALDTLGALGLWAPWKVSKADAEAGVEATTTRTATAQLLLQLAEEARVSGEELQVVATHWSGDRWPAPRELIEAAKKRRPAAGPTAGCRLGERESCSAAGLIHVAVHYTDAEGLPAVWNGACYCDCERGLLGAARQAEPLTKDGPPRAPGVTLRMLHQHYAQRGTLVDFIVAPDPWQQKPVGHPRHRPPTPEQVAFADRLHRAGADARALAERAVR